MRETREKFDEVSLSLVLCFGIFCVGIFCDLKNSSTPEKNVFSLLFSVLKILKHKYFSFHFSYAF